MGVRTALSVGVDAVSLVLHHVACLTQSPVGQNRKHRHTAPAIVGHQHVSAGLVEAQVARPRALGRLMVQQGQLAGFRGDGEGAHRSGRLAGEIGHLVDRVEVAPLRVEGQVGGILQASAFTFQFQGA